MEKHTPGPWTYRSVYDGLEIGNGIVRAAVVPYKDAEGEANAKLISAAPDLLEALTMCINLVAAFSNQSEPAMNAWNKAKSAIQKATQ